MHPVAWKPNGVQAVGLALAATTANMRLFSAAAAGFVAPTAGTYWSTPAARVDHAEGVGTGGSGAEVRSRHVEVAVPGIVPGLIPAADRQDGRDIAGPRVHEERPPAPRYHHSSARAKRWVIDAEEPPGGGSEPERLAIDVVLLFHRKGRDRGIEKQYDIDCQALGLTATAGGLFGINDPSLG